MSSGGITTPIDVDLNRSMNAVWLVKMPKYLSEILNEHASAMPNNEIGRLVKRTLSTGPSSSSSQASTSGVRAQEATFCLSDKLMERIEQVHKGSDFKMPPQEHRFCLTNMADDNVLRAAYLRSKNNPNTPTGEHIALLGKVGKRAEVRPVENDQYMSMKKKQFSVSQEPKRKAKIIKIQKNIYAPIRNHKANIKREKQKKLAGKRIRGSEDDVTRLIFELFDKHEYYSMSALERLTQQPKSYLQQILKKYCNYNSSGHNYELKRDYKYYGDKPKNDGEDDDDDDDDMDDDDDDDDDMDDDDNMNNNNTTN